VTVTINIITSSSTPVSAFTPASKMMEIMQSDFGFPIHNRLAIIPEVDMFRIKEDKSIYEQVKSEKYDYHVTWDGEFVCFFNITDHPQRIRIKILQGLKTLINEGKIFWDIGEYDRIAKEKKERERIDTEARESARVKPTTPEEKIVHEAIRRAVKLKKKK